MSLLGAAGRAYRVAMENNMMIEQRSPQRLAYSVAEAAEATGLGRTSLYGLMNEGKLEFKKIGARRLIPAASLAALLEVDAK